MIRTELCLSDQLETSASASEIIQELHQLEPKSCCQIALIWATLFLTSLTPNIGLAVSDIFSDAYLTVEYHSQMMNTSYVELHASEWHAAKEYDSYPPPSLCSLLRLQESVLLHHYLPSHSPSFLPVRVSHAHSNYEPTGLRHRLQQTWAELMSPLRTRPEALLSLMKLAVYIFLTMVALALWQPVTAMCKFYRDARYEASEGTTKVIRRKEKRYVDLAASRGELIEVSIEAVFELWSRGTSSFHP